MTCDSCLCDMWFAIWCAVSGLAMGFYIGWGVFGGGR